MLCQKGILFKYTDQDLTSRFILGKSVFMYATKQDIEDLKCYYQEFTTVPKLGFSEIKTKQKDTFIWQGCIKLIKSDCEYIYNVTKVLFLK